MAGAGNIPIVKLRNLVVGKSYRLLDPTVAPHILAQSQMFGDEIKKLLNNLHARPHILRVKRRLPNGWMEIQFEKNPRDEAVIPEFVENNQLVVTGDLLAKFHDAEFAEEAMRGGKRKTRKQKRKHRKCSRKH